MTVEDERREPADADSPGSAMTEFHLAASLYALWVGLVYVSALLDQTILPRAASFVLLVGIIATNALFLLIANSNVLYRPPASVITLAQCIIGITWATLFAFLSDSPGELVFGMYISAFIFSVLRVGRRSQLHLAIFATTSFALVVLIKAVWEVPLQAAWPELMRILIFAGVMSCLLLYGRHQNRLKSELAARFLYLQKTLEEVTESAEFDGSARLFNRQYILESLAREKGRTDRSNHSFSVCLFDIDGFNNLHATHGSLVCDRILGILAGRVRGELRAMDGFESSGSRQAFGRFSEAEYIVILPQTNQSGAGHCAERIRAAMANSLIDGKYAVTVSGGVVQYRRGETIPELLKRADDLLLAARDAGGNQVVGGEHENQGRADVIQLHGWKN